MFKVIIRRVPGWAPFDPNYMNDRISSIRKQEHANMFRQFVEAGLVSNTSGPNCYIRELEDCVEVCNATWTSLEAAQQYLVNMQEIPFVISAEIRDESDNVLDSFSN